MKQETLEEAIKEHLYANAFAADPDNPGFVDRFIEHTKAAEWGAEWQRNHVWHDATETPDGKRRYLVETHLGKRTHHSVWTKAFTPKEKVEDDDVIVRWAYLEDILPLPCKEGDKHE